MENMFFLTVPEELKNLEVDEYGMVELNTKNVAMVRECIKIDSDYELDLKENIKSNKKEILTNKDSTKEDYYKIIKDIAINNSTRTPDENLHSFADFCYDKSNKFFTRLKNGEIALVDELVNSGKKRKDKSLASKVCRYFEDWVFSQHNYPIYDSIVKSVLPYYLGKNGIEFNTKDLHSEYEYYSKRFKELFKTINCRTNALKIQTIHDLDYLLWYSYKSDRIRIVAADALYKKYYKK